MSGATVVAQRPNTQAQLAEVLGNWASGSGPLHRKLASAIRAAIERGELTVGTRLPAERVFATHVSVSRSTVFAAWEGLKQEGWLESRQGSGTWVRLPDERRGISGGVDSMESLRGIFLSAVAGSVDFTTGQLEGSPSIPGAVAEVASDQRMSALLATRHLLPQGAEELRRAVSARFADIGVPTSPEQVLITSGYQQAIWLVASLFVRPGDTIVVEDPTSLGALDAFRAVGGRMRGVEFGESGLAVEDLAQMMSGLRPQLVSLTPTFHNPTGSVLPGLHRRRIARLARQFEVPLVEDLTHADIGFESAPPPIAHFDQDAPVISIGSMSKLYWSGLRVGWIRGSSQLIARLSRLKTVTDLGTPVLSQLVSARLLADEENARRHRVDQVHERLLTLVSALERHLPDWRWSMPRGGLALWAQLPRPCAPEFAQLALRHGVIVLPGPLLSPNEGHRDRVRLCFHPPPDEIEAGVERLAQAWAAFNLRSR
jgi:DNA-binding transcriptional MocR family regulator